MADKLGIGEAMPAVTIDVVDGGTLELPNDLDGRYKMIIFYRGHW